MKHISKITRIITTCAFTTVAVAVHAANLVPNGSFENGSPPFNLADQLRELYVGSTDLTGWAVVETGPAQFRWANATYPAWVGTAASPASDGNLFLYFNGSFNNASARGKITTSVIFPSAGNYRLAFDMWSEPSRRGSRQAGFTADLAGLVSYTDRFTPPFSLNDNNPVVTAANWQHVSHDFTVSAASVGIPYLLSFTDASIYGDPAVSVFAGVTPSPFLDNVTLTELVPTVQCPPPVIVECASSAGAPVTLTAHVQNPSGGPLVVTWDVAGDSTIEQTDAVPASGPPTSADVSFTHAYPAGISTIKVTVADGTALPADCTTTVTVHPDMPPTVQCSPDITADQNSAFGAIVTYTTTASDLCDAHPVVTCFPPSGSIFPLGPTTVTCSATDDQGNLSAPCTFTVTVIPPPSTCGRKVTGGGFIPGTGRRGGKDNFGFIVQADTSCLLKGNVNYLDVAGNQFQSTTLTALVVAGSHALIIGTGTINHSGLYSFVVNVDDLGEPGTTDTFKIEIASGFVNGNVLGKSGNIQIHKP